MLSRTLFGEIGIPTTLKRCTTEPNYSSYCTSAFTFPVPLPLCLSASLPRYASLATNLNPSPTSSYNQSSLFSLHRLPA